MSGQRRGPVETLPPGLDPRRHVAQPERPGHPVGERVERQQAEMVLGGGTVTATPPISTVAGSPEQPGLLPFGNEVPVVQVDGQEPDLLLEHGPARPSSPGRSRRSVSPPGRQAGIA